MWSFSRCLKITFAVIVNQSVKNDVPHPWDHAQKLSSVGGVSSDGNLIAGLEIGFQRLYWRKQLERSLHTEADTF